MSKHLAIAFLSASILLVGSLPVRGAATITPFNSITVSGPTATPRGDEALAIDGNDTTLSHLTLAFSTGRATAFLGLARPLPVVGLRLRKVTANIDGGGSLVDPMELIFRVSGDSLALTPASRTYSLVTGLTDGRDGIELFQFDLSGSGGGVDAANARLKQENSPGVQEGADGWYSVTFDRTLASAVSFEFGQSAGGSSFTHYGVFEFEALVAPEPAGLGLMGIGAIVLLRRKR